MSIGFNPTIDLSSLITFFGFVIGGLGVVFTLRSEVRSLSGRMMMMEKELAKMAEILVAIGRQDERLNGLEARLEDLRQIKRH